jgi:hypothetical protein
LGGFRSLLASEAPPDYTRQKDFLFWSIHSIPAPSFLGTLDFHC